MNYKIECFKMHEDGKGIVRLQDRIYHVDHLLKGEEALVSLKKRELKVEKILKEEMSHIASLSAKLAEIMN